MMKLDYWVLRQWGLLVAAMVLVLDDVSKELILHHYASGGGAWWLVPGQVGFSLGWNRGMSFSLLNDWAHAPWLLGALAVVISGWFVHWLGERGVQAPRGWLHQGALGLIIGGAWGNLVDRVQHGAVVDFVVVNPWGWFPYTFNVADAAITCGVIGMLALGVIDFREQKRAGQQAQKKG